MEGRSGRHKLCLFSSGSFRETEEGGGQKGEMDVLVRRWKVGRIKLNLSRPK